MDNTKAIALLRRMQEPEAYEPQITAEAFEALGMAIKALEQASFPQRHENDTISRQAAIDCVTVGAKPMTIRGRIAELPSAQPGILTCKDCYWWTKQEDSMQGRCARYGMYPTGYWYCAAARRRKDETD